MSTNIFDLDKNYIENTYARFPVALVSGKGSLLYDSEGRRYIDLGGGIAVNSFGASDDEWVNAVTAQLGKLQHTSNLYYTEPQVTLAQMLCERTGMKKVFFSNSGAEANECAIKAARKYAFDKYGEGKRPNIVTLKNSFHGRTLATLTATGQDGYHTYFNPFPEGFLYADANDIGAMESLVGAGGVCAVMIELVQGEGGVMALEPSYVKALSELTAENDVLLIIDEVQTGNGRAGALYAYMDYDVAPDIVTTAKGLAGGLPLGATMFSEKTAGTLKAGDHGSTFGGNPVCAAGAVNILSRIDGELLAGVREKSAYLFERLGKAEGVISVSGAGLMIGIRTKRPAKEVAAGCLEKGVLVLTAKDRVRLLPALNIPAELLAEAAETLISVIEN
ncbi:MAG: acetylornithine/succinylornithine family transaminase [Oscillospiraceae bacterium]|nr:acetylornithine/succinylornithine family transaminase [Oscillospiraceae bacterium]